MSIPQNLKKPAILKLPTEKTVEKAGLNCHRVVFDRFGQVYGTVETFNRQSICAIEIADDSEVDSVFIYDGGYAFPAAANTDIEVRRPNRGQMFMVGAKKPWIGKLENDFISLVPVQGLSFSQFLIATGLAFPNDIDPTSRLSLNVYTGDYPPVINPGIRDPLTFEFHNAGAGVPIAGVGSFQRAICVTGRAYFEASYRGFPQPATTGDTITVTWYGVSSYRRASQNGDVAVTIRQTIFPAGTTSATLFDNFVSDCPYDFIVLIVDCAGAETILDFAGRLKAHDE